MAPASTAIATLLATTTLAAVAMLASGTPPPLLRRRLVRRDAQLVADGDGGDRRLPGTPLDDMRDVVEAMETEIGSDPTLGLAGWKTSKPGLKSGTPTVVMDAGVAKLETGAWIESRSTLTRPTSVEAKIKSSGMAGAISMTVFASDHGHGSMYSVTTGYGADDNQVLVMPGATTTFWNDTDNNNEWQTVRFELKADKTEMYVNELLMKVSTDVSLTQGPVQFVAAGQPMVVKDVRWRLNCAWTMWTDQECSVTCGAGTMRQTRIRSREPAFGGHACTGLAAKSAKCNAGSCKMKAVQQQEKAAAVAAR